MNEIRFDPIHNRRVILSPGRARRGSGKKGPCAFCPSALKVSREPLLAREGAGGGWEIAVIANRFPAVTPDSKKAYGHHRLVIDTPMHAAALSTLSVEHLSRLLDVYAEQARELRKDPKVKYVVVFKNRGEDAGASQPHAHTQILALDFVPESLREAAERAFAHRQRHKTCAACEELRKELRGPRRIASDRRAAAFAPRASGFPYEAVIRPKRHVDNLTELDAQERLSMARFLKRILSFLERKGASYNFYIHDVIENDDQHFGIRVLPRLSRWGGLEFASGVTVNTVPPERAARDYRS